MKNPRKLLFPLAALPALLCSCAKEIVMDAGEEPVVAVECILSEQPVQTLRLSFTKGAAMDEAPALSEAEAVLIDMTESKTIGSFERQDDGTWTLGYAAVPEHSYRLEVDVPGHETVWAEQTMPPECIFYSAFICYYCNDFNLISPYGSSFIPVTYTETHAWVRALNYNPETGCREIAELICTDAADVDNFNLAGEIYTPPVSDTDVFGNNVTSYLYPNLSGASMHKRYLRLKISDDTPIYLSGSFTGNYYHRENLFTQKPIDRPPEDDEGIVIFSYVSEEYDRFLREAVYYQQLSEGSDLTSAYVRDNIFTNIHGGLGIFGAKTETVVEWVPAYTQDLK